MDLPLVLLPGTLCDARIFEPLLKRLGAQNTHVFLTAEAPSLEQAAEEVLATAPARFALVGFSLGGMVAMEAVLRAPTRVCGLALLSTTPLAVPPERLASRREAVSLAASMPMARFVREHLWPDYGGQPNDTQLLPLLQDMATALGHTAFARQTQQALGRSDFCKRLSAVKCPALIVSGEADPLCPPAAQQYLARALPHSTSVLLPAAGHFAVYEQADEIASAVAAWFQPISSAQHKAWLASGMHQGDEPMKRESE
ncbi:alpha/beta fold hydrolase [Terriglobus aquaticus]|uniref:Alpha/beta fold hydrolase n=1 Tax=Terriglobus aquaticus TaxID=940139 RepID=A0ABW9KIX9_9BACT|nr:alpha/beta hydrolase [Terriglobus aquaticus]